MFRLADRDHRFFGERRRRAGLHAGAAGDAFGIEEMFMRAGRDARSETAALDRQRKRALHFLAGANAARADDAFRRVIGEIRIRLVLRHPLGVDLAAIARPDVIVALVAVTHVAKAHGTCHVLQFAVTVGGAGETVERVVGDIELHDAATDVLQPAGLGVHHHARHGRRGAGGRRSVTPLDLHETEAAGTEGIDHIGRTEFRHLDAGLHRSAHDRGAFRHRDRSAVDGECHLGFGPGSRRTVVDFMNEGHCVSPVRKK